MQLHVACSTCEWQLCASPAELYLPCSQGDRLLQDQLRSLPLHPARLRQALPRQHRRPQRRLLQAQRHGRVRTLFADTAKLALAWLSCRRRCVCPPPLSRSSCLLAACPVAVGVTRAAARWQNGRTGLHDGRSCWLCTGVSLLCTAALGRSTRVTHLRAWHGRLLSIRSR